MNIKVTVPKDLSEITLDKYKHYLDIASKNKDDKFLQAKMIEIFCNISLKDVYRLKYNDTLEITSILTEMFDQKPALVKRFKIDNVEYGFHNSLDDLTLGEYIDLDTYIGDWDNIEKAMNVLYRPITNKFGSKYSITEYDAKDNIQILQMPMDAVTSSIFFFYRLGLDLSKVMMNSLDNNQNKVLTEYLNSIPGTDGIQVFTDSLEEILQNLSISPN
jgi:hypothetical protein|tara:strand:+ start:1204 stop:1854 length:651 start_codon:yes stop_codon:yes gene_type:complete